MKLRESSLKVVMMDSAAFIYPPDMWDDDSIDLRRKTVYAFPPDKNDEVIEN